MKRFGAALLLTATACAGIGEATTTVKAEEAEPDRFVAELTAAGVDAAQIEAFST